MTIFKLWALFLVLIVAGCTKAPEQAPAGKQIESATDTGAKVDPQKQETIITGETEQGTYSIASGPEAQIPEDFPTDIYIYRPSKIMAAMDRPGGNSLGLATADDVSTVAKAYKREMTAKGWSQKSAEQDGGRLMHVYEKQGRIANIMIGTVEGAAQVMIMVTE